MLLIYLSASCADGLESVFGTIAYPAGCPTLLFLGWVGNFEDNIHDWHLFSFP